MRTKELIHEFKHHLPFTSLAVIIGIIIVFGIKYFFQKEISEDLFNIFHPLHIIASATVTAGIFYKYKSKIIPAILIGITGAIIIGTISDVLFPFLGGALLSLKTIFHFPLIETPILILSSAILGSIIGITTKTTKIPHFLHVFLSVFASLFYLLAFSTIFSILHFLIAFIIIFVAVIIPCCGSDILFPFFFLGKEIKTCNCEV